MQRGADGARGDDANTLKTSVASWLNEQDPHPVPLFIVGEKRGRGFDHNVTGKLLCPVDYNWFDPPYVPSPAWLSFLTSFQCSHCDQGLPPTLCCDGTHVADILVPKGLV